MTSPASRTSRPPRGTGPARWEDACAETRACRQVRDPRASNPTRCNTLPRPHSRPRPHPHSRRRRRRHERRGESARLRPKFIAYRYVPNAAMVAASAPVSRNVPYSRRHVRENPAPRAWRDPGGLVPPSPRPTKTTYAYGASPVWTQEKGESARFVKTDGSPAAGDGAARRRARRCVDWSSPHRRGARRGTRRVARRTSRRATARACRARRRRRIATKRLLRANTSDQGEPVQTLREKAKRPAPSVAAACDAGPRFGSATRTAA